MIPTWMIREIERRREEQRARQHRQPQLELPVHQERSGPPSPPSGDAHGPIVIEL